MDHYMSQSWVNWIHENLARNCSEESMIKAMVDSGVEIECARQWILSVVNGDSNSNVTDISDKSRIPTQDYVEIEGHIIHITMRFSSPQIALFENLLSSEECDELIHMARPKLVSSNVVDPVTGESSPHENRTSDGTYFQRGENALVQKLETRISFLLDYPVNCGEGIQVLHYTKNKEYQPHYDYFDITSAGARQHLKKGGQRVATLIMYLNDVRAGGATFFPNLGIGIHPKKGSALYFENATTDGIVDPRTLHGGAPVLDGEKWIATKWIRQKIY